MYTYIYIYIHTHIQTHTYTHTPARTGRQAAVLLLERLVLDAGLGGLVVPEGRDQAAEPVRVGLGRRLYLYT